jgi:hypothetical protein
MAQGSGFFKGENKKKKKGDLAKNKSSFAPVFTPPKVVGKDKKEY